MMRLLFALVAIVGAGLLGGCEPAPSTRIAPEVQKPDFSKMSGKELLEYKKKNEPGMSR